MGIMPDGSGAATTPGMGQDHVDIWHANVALSLDRIDNLQQALSADELCRAKRFRSQHERCRFVTTRGALRTILADYLNLGPAQICFRYDCRCGHPQCRLEGRKPILDYESHAESLHFNVSHSHNSALIAVSRHREVGIDLEWIDPSLDYLPLAESILTPNELLALQAATPAEQRVIFFSAWTRKEAFIKATGLGFSLDPGRFAVLAMPRQSVTLIDMQCGASRISRWSLHALDLGPSYVGALAGEGLGIQLHYRRWPCED